MDELQAYTLLQNPHLHPKSLDHIAKAFPQHRLLVAQHPALKGELASWLAHQGDPEIIDVLVARGLLSRPEASTQGASVESNSKPRRGHRKLVTIVASVMMLAVVGGLGVWWFSGKDTPSELVPPKTVAAGKELAARLAGDDDAIAARQTVADQDFFYYTFNDEDLIEGADGYPYITDQLVISMADGAGLEEAEKVADSINANVVGANTLLDDYQLLLIDPQREESLVALGEKVAQSSEVATAEPNLVTHITLSNDDRGTEWSDQWGPSLGEGNWGMQAIGAPAIWDYVDATNPLEEVKVGVLDEFYRDNWHKDLEIDPEGYIAEGAPIEGSSPHGVHVSGIIATRGNDSPGVKGVAPNAKLLIASPISLQKRNVPSHAKKWFVGDEYSDAFTLNTTTANLVDRGARVLNMSFTDGAAAKGPYSKKEREKALEKVKSNNSDFASMLNKLLTEKGKDFLIVKGSGNESCSAVDVAGRTNLEMKLKYATKEIANVARNELETDSCDKHRAPDTEWSLAFAAEEVYPEVTKRLITVGSLAPALGGTPVGENIPMSGFAIDGYSTPGADVAAPGARIVSTVNLDTAESGDSLPNSYAPDSGTSMATPHVSGLAAALFGVNTDLTTAQVKQIIIGTANSAPLAQWDRKDEHSVPIVNGAAAFQVALMTRSMGDSEKKAFLDEVESGLISISGNRELSPQLLGTWCTIQDSGPSSKPDNCFNLKDHLELNPAANLASGAGGQDPNLTPIDITARSSIASELRICAQENCDPTVPQTLLTYYPPGATSSLFLEDSSEPVDEVKKQAHDLAYPRLIEATFDEAGNAEAAQVYRLSLQAKGKHPGLPFAEAKIISVPVPTPSENTEIEDRYEVPEHLRGTWCPRTGDGFSGDIDTSSERCFSFAEMFKVAPEGGMESYGFTHNDGGIEHGSACTEFNSEPGDLEDRWCGTYATTYFDYYPVGVSWDCEAYLASPDNQFRHLKKCEPDFTLAHDARKARLVIPPNHQQLEVYWDSVPLYRD